MANPRKSESNLPPFTPFPPANFRNDLVPEEWEACLDAWVTLAEAHLRLSNESFSRGLSNNSSDLVSFLVSYLEQASKFPNDPSLTVTERAKFLRKDVFLLSHRLLSGDEIFHALLQWTFLADLSNTFPRSKAMQDLFTNLWKRQGTQIERSLQEVKAWLIQSLDFEEAEKTEQTLRKLVPLLYASPNAGAYFATGSDLLDGLAAAYGKTSTSFQRVLVAFALLCLSSLCHGDRANFSLLSDHLYSLKENAEAAQKSGHPSLLADIVTNTSLLSKIRDALTGPEAGRASKLEAALTPFKQSSNVRTKRIATRDVDKGKGKADEFGNITLDEVHVHRLTLISQIQDLFPDLGTSFIHKLLDEYNDDAEEVTAHLLDNSLPDHLQKADRSEQLPTSVIASSTDWTPHLAPRPTPPSSPPRRRNIFDNDELDNLTVDASRLHIGRKNDNLTADTLLQDRSSAPSKAAILSALAAFDSDDDERDDTYDVSDVGGTVNTTASALADEADVDQNEEALYQAWKTDASVFERDAATRRGKARAALKSETTMTDEAIEGWGLMLARDPRRVRRLEAMYGTFTGQQNQVGRTAWRAGEVDDDERDEDLTRDRGGRVRASGMGRGRGVGRGGNVAGSSGDNDTQKARQRKEANKASRANHNRREQRAKKMARGGFAG
jgi:activating signal cointegrator complex subunit 2